MTRAFPIALVLCLPLLAAAQPAETATPPDLQDVDIVEHLGDTIPLDLTFRDEADRPVKLAELVKGDKPVILTLVYFNCPMLCNLVLNGLVGGLRELKWTPGKDFRIITVSIDHREKPDLAVQKKKGALVDRARAETLVFRLARQERDVWVTWPGRVAALMAAQIMAEVERQSGASVTIETAIMQRVLEAHVREQLDALADLRVSLG